MKLSLAIFFLFIEWVGILLVIWVLLDKKFPPFLISAFLLCLALMATGSTLVIIGSIGRLLR